MQSDLVKIKRYDSSQLSQWDNFTLEAKNSYFFFKRGFMEYHSDRFNDHSLMIYYEDKLIALLPGHIEAEIFYTHRGLTFGGFLLSEDIKLMKMLSIFQELKKYFNENGIEKCVYKAIPSVYHSQPCDEDLFALHFNGAKLICREVTSVLDLQNPIAFSKGKRSSVKKAQKEALEIKEDLGLEEYFSMMERLLEEKYQTKPVHTYSEMKLLQEKFPMNIKLYTAYKSDEILAGVLVFVDKEIVKTQYISSTKLGRDLGAVDFIIDTLVHSIYSDKKYFDFGTSVEKNELGFNESLMAQKELFGARAVAKDAYEWLVKEEIAV